MYETDHDEDDGRTRGEGAKATRRSVHETDHDEDGRRKLEEEERRRRDEAFTRPSTRVEIRGKVPAERGHGHLDARAMRRSRARCSDEAERNEDPATRVEVETTSP